jgi:D-glycero-alpha-D-manno-heptose-7-phosphate kinase
MANGMSSLVINAVAPTRICDVGGWTDTHFAEFGAVFNVAIYPYVEVQIHTLPPDEAEGRLIVAVENYGASYALDPENIVYDKHPLIEAAIKCMDIPRERALRINIFSYAPPGASTGTSAAVSVALIGALDALAGGRLSLHETAVMAHSIETKELGLECGVQDQLASAHGGINLIEIPEFPRTNVIPLQIPDPVWWELEHRLVLTYIGKPHNSSEIHKLVIKDLGQSPRNDYRLEGLRQLAQQAKAALGNGDFAELGRVFNQNTAIQRRLHPHLVCPKFEEIIGIAEDFHALGCKVNGAGGDGGSIAILSNGEMWEKRKMQQVLLEKGFKTIPIYLSRRGLRVWQSAGNKMDAAHS